MNKVILMGRLTRDPEIRVSAGESGIKSARYTLAVDRRKKSDGTQETDFISCVAFGKTADFVEKYLQKGRQMVVSGRIQTGSYTNKDGNTVYTTDVVVDEHFFADSRSNANNTNAAAAPAPMPAPNPATAAAPVGDLPFADDEDIPFN